MNKAFKTNPYRAIKKTALLRLKEKLIEKTKKDKSCSYPYFLVA